MNEALKTAKPILFNTEMVRAILDGRKTVTRRVVKPQPVVLNSLVISPYQVGDILYVRETWKRFCGILYGRENGTYIPLDDFEGYQYKSDKQCVCTKGINPFCDDFGDQKDDIRFDNKWHPSIHMPKEAARIFLRVTNVRVERLQDITDEQVVAEGIDIPKTANNEERCLLGFARYSKLWNSTVKKSDLNEYGWNANPFVWVIEFERVEENE